MKKKIKKKKPLNLCVCVFFKGLLLCLLFLKENIYRKKKKEKKSKMMGLFGETHPSPVLGGLFTLL
jgi:hypothetical protein